MKIWGCGSPWPFTTKVISWPCLFILPHDFLSFLDSLSDAVAHPCCLQPGVAALGWAVGWRHALLLSRSLPRQGQGCNGASHPSPEPRWGRQEEGVFLRFWSSDPSRQVLFQKLDDFDLHSNCKLGDAVPDCWGSQEEDDYAITWGIGNSLDRQSRKFWKRYYQDSLSDYIKFNFQCLSCSMKQPGLNWSVPVLKPLPLALKDYAACAVEQKGQYVLHSIRERMAVKRAWINKKPSYSQAGSRESSWALLNFVHTNFYQRRAFSGRHTWLLSSSSGIACIFANLGP